MKNNYRSLDDDWNISLLEQNLEFWASAKEIQRLAANFLASHVGALQVYSYTDWIDFNRLMNNLEGNHKIWVLSNFDTFKRYYCAYTEKPEFANEGVFKVGTWYDKPFYLVENVLEDLLIFGIDDKICKIYLYKNNFL
jgi:hypothetical protein